MISRRAESGEIIAVIGRAARISAWPIRSTNSFSNFKPFVLPVRQVRAPTTLGIRLYEMGW
jgi:hypothetical protein